MKNKLELVGPSGAPLRLVVLDCPVNTWESQDTRELFTKMVRLKLNGYWAEYPHHVIVTDSSDFVGTHLMVCEEGTSLEPIMAYKSVALSRTEYFNQAFPLLSCLKAIHRESELGIAEKILASCRERSVDISYDSAWTVSKEVRKNKEMGKTVRDLVTTLGVFYHLDYPVQEWVTGGVVKFKTDQYFEWMGLKAFTEAIAFPNLGGEVARLLHSQKVSEEALATAKKFQSLWEDRIEISADRAAKIAA